MTMGNGAIYAETRERVAALVRSLSPDELHGVVPTTPAWSPRDIVGHLAGVASDAVTGTIGGLGTEPWTAVQVEARRAMTLEEVLARGAGCPCHRRALSRHLRPLPVRRTGHHRMIRPR